MYAADRQAKGFNAALLMSVQPVMNARGPRDRTQDEGFAVGFEDPADGYLNELKVDYVQYLDGLFALLVEHEIVPVPQSVFHGFWWKASTCGTKVPPAEYARYCRYLVARYGARPMVYLVVAHGSGEKPQIAAGGKEVSEWDAYGQLTGVHNPPRTVTTARTRTRIGWTSSGGRPVTAAST